MINNKDLNVSEHIIAYVDILGYKNMIEEYKYSI